MIIRYAAKAIITLILVCFAFSSCGTADISGEKEYFGFKASAFTVVEEKDTHGGFHGEGSYYLILYCSEKKEQATELVKNRTPLPLSENLQLITYGGEKDGVNYGYELADEAHWPAVTGGVYKFIDRTREQTTSQAMQAYSTDHLLIFPLRYMIQILQHCIILNLIHK